MFGNEVSLLDSHATVAVLFNLLTTVLRCASLTRRCRAMTRQDQVMYVSLATSFALKG